MKLLDGSGVWVSRVAAGARLLLSAQSALVSDKPFGYYPIHTFDFARKHIHRAGLVGRDYMPTTIAIYPQEESESRIVSEWLRECIETCSARWPGRRFLGTEGHVSREKVTTLLRDAMHDDTKPIVAFYGHGTRCSLSVKGSEAASPGVKRTRTPDRDCDKCWECVDLPVGDPLVDVENSAMLAGCEVYAMACSSMTKLGTAVLREGRPGTAYYGFDQLVVLPMGETLNKLGVVINAGLIALHDQERHPVRAHRLAAARDTVRSGLFELFESLNAGPDISMDAVFVESWSVAFDARWV